MIHARARHSRGMNTPNTPLLQRLPRLSGWLLITIALLICVALIAPHQLPVSLYKLSLVSLAAVVGYWLDRSIFPYARPDGFMDVFSEVSPPSTRADDLPESSLCVADNTLMWLAGAAMLRRAIIIGCAMLTMGLGA